jgi:O-antigen/teichoic acid export membrane protein
LAIVPTALLQRELDFASMFIVNVGASLANAAVSLLLAANGHGAIALAWGAFGQQAARSLLSMWRAGWPSPFPLTLRGAGPVVSFGTGASMLAVSGALGGRMPELVIGRLRDIAAVGLYGRAVGLAGQLRMLLTGAVGGVFYPAFARLRDEGTDLAAPYVRVVACYSAVTWPAMAFLAAAAAPLIGLLYGPTWLQAAPLLVWIAVSEMIFTALPLHMEIPILLGRMRQLIWLNLLDTLASILLLAIMAVYGLEWAAASRVVYGFVWLLIYGGFMRGLIGFRWRAILNVHAKSLAASAATVAPLLIQRQFDPTFGAHLLELAGAALAGCGAWLCLILVTGHPLRDEILTFARGVRKTLGQRAARAHP